MSCANTMPKTKIQNEIENLINLNYDWQIIRDIVKNNLNKCQIGLILKKKKIKILMKKR